MTNKVLARKWRPQKFAEVVAQEHVVRALQHGIKNNSLHHAYLLTGTRGVGKTTLARILAKAVNCLNLTDSVEPCGQCSQCQAIEKGNFPDLLELDAATNTGIDNMRDLQDTLAYPPYSGKKKVYVIDEVHMLSTAAFNAMLKTFEEPPEYLIFILATTDPQKVPVTVLSRCLQFNLKPIAEATLTEHFIKILKSENCEFEDSAIPLIARAADGSVRDGLSLLDQLIAQGGGKVLHDDVAKILGIIGKDWSLPMLAKIINGKVTELLNATDELEERGLSYESALIEIAKNVLAVQIVQMGGPCPQGVSEVQAQELTKEISAADLQLLYQIVINGRRDLSFAPDEKSGFLMTILRMSAFMPKSAPVEVTRPTINSPINNPSEVGDGIVNTAMAEKKNPK